MPNNKNEWASLQGTEFLDLHLSHKQIQHMLWQAGTRSRGSWEAGTPSNTNRNLKAQNTVDTVSLGLRDLSFSQNNRLTTGGLKNKIKIYDVLDEIKRTNMIRRRDLN